MGEAAAAAGPSETELAAGAPQEAAPSDIGRKDIAGGTSIASIGLQAYGDVLEAKSAKAGYEFRADRAERAAKIGRIQADQTDAALREELAVSLANIDSIRASSGVDPDSPTGMVLKSEEQRLADRNRTNKVTSISEAARQSDADALYLRGVGDAALRTGNFNAGVRVVKGLASLGK